MIMYVYNAVLDVILYHDIIYIYICIILLFGTIEMDMQKHISKIYIEL